MRQPPTRRRVGVRLIAVLAAGAMLAAACGDDDDASTAETATTAAGPAATTAAGAPATTAAGGEPATTAAGEATTTAAATPEGEADPDAYVRVARPINLDAGFLDPTLARTRANGDDLRLIYGNLMRSGENGTIEPGLATSVEATDPTTVVIELQPGVTFSDGTPFDAEAVKAGLERSLAAENRTGYRAEFFAIEEITVDSPTGLTLKLNRPVAGAVATHASGMEMMIVAPSATDPATNPIGAGPYVLEEFVPDTVYKLKKNEQYYDADNVKAAGIEYVRVPANDLTVTVNALLSGQADVASALTPTSVDALASDQNIEVITSLDTNSVIGLSWCKSEPPLDDVRVRKALALASDKEAMNTLLFNGEGEVAWGMSQEGHPFYDPTQVGVNAFDQEEAKRLLAEAGYPDGFEIGMFYQSAGDPQRAAEILQQQWAEVGVQVTLEPVANLLTDYYQEVRNPILMLNDTGVNNIVRQYGTPESIANVCQYADPAFVDPLNKLSELAYGSPEWIEQLHVVEDLLNEHMVNEEMVFPPRSVAFNSRVGGVRVIGNYTGNPIIDLFDTYIIAS